MKVLQINVVYQKGSTGKITYDLHKGLLETGAESVVCYGRGELLEEPGVYKTCPEWYSKLNNALSRATGIMYGGCFFSTNRLISIIRNEKPDVVHLQCINGYFVNIYSLVKWLKKNKIKTVLTLHAEFMYTANCGHALECDRWKVGCGRCPRRKEETGSILIDGTSVSWRRMKRAFEGFENDLAVVSVSPWLEDRAKQSPILERMYHCVVYNGVDTQVFHPYGGESAAEIKKELNISGERVVFHATAGFSDDRNHIKGGYYIIELAKRLPNVVFVVAGRIKNDMKVPENLILLGPILDGQRLAKLYSMADLTVITSKKETFSMVVAESLCCGTPIVGFQAGAPETITIPQFSSFSEYGDLDLLEQNVISFLELDHVGISRYAAAVYSKENMCKRYIRLYEKLMNEAANENNKEY